jgi:hypothetical protein
MNDKTLQEQFEILEKRAKNCETMYEALKKSNPGLIHEWGRSQMGVMWGYWKVKGWDYPITEEHLLDWKSSVEYHENRLSKIAREL